MKMLCCFGTKLHYTATDKSCYGNVLEGGWAVWGCTRNKGCRKMIVPVPPPIPEYKARQSLGIGESVKCVNWCVNRELATFSISELALYRGRSPQYVTQSQLWPCILTPYTKGRGGVLCIRLLPYLIGSKGKMCVQSMVNGWSTVRSIVKSWKISTVKSQTAQNSWSKFKPTVTAMARKWPPPFIEREAAAILYLWTIPCGAEYRAWHR